MPPSVVDVVWDLDARIIGSLSAIRYATRLVGGRSLAGLARQFGWETGHVHELFKVGTAVASPSKTTAIHFLSWTERRVHRRCFHWM